MTTSSTSSSGSNSSIVAQPIVSVAGSTSAAAAGGSVINVSALVSELVAATEAPQQAIISSQTQAVTANISALGSLKSALSTFQTALASLSTPGSFNAQSANSSNQNVFTATAATGAVSGNYSIAVSALASAQQLLSAGVTGGSTVAIGTGTLSISLGGTSFTVAINGTNDTLSGVAAAINAATGNPGVAATVLQGTDGAHLVLSSTLTGAANTISVTETDGGTGLASLTYGTGNLKNYTVEAPAQDATFSIAGVPYTSASNTVSTALGGVTLNLTGTTAANVSATLSVANDTSGVETNINSFVSAYNTLQSALASLGSYDSTTNTAGAMQGNPILENIQSQIQEALYSVVGTSSYNSLASVGITTNSDGSLSVNSTTLEAALGSNFSAVSNLFSSSNGIATQLNNQITNDLSSSGSVSSYSQSLIKQENALTAQTSALNTQMAALTASMTQQYAALNVLLSSLQTTSAALSQSLSSLPDSPTAPHAIG
jgi:flagellar hook-associated protein 2